MSAERHGGRRDRGSASVELVMLTVPLMVLVAFAVFVGRYASTNQELGSAARDAARAAAVRQDPVGARADAERAARATLDGRGISCRDLTVKVDTADLRPGGEVTALVRCRSTLADLGGFGLPGSVLVEAEATMPVDAYRGGEP